MMSKRYRHDRCVFLSKQGGSTRKGARRIYVQAYCVVHISYWGHTILGITRDYPLTALVVPLDRSALAGPFGRANLAPLLSWFTAQDDTDGLTACQQLLTNAGRGHTAIIHTRSRARVEQLP